MKVQLTHPILVCVGKILIVEQKKTQTCISKLAVSSEDELANQRSTRMNIFKISIRPHHSNTDKLLFNIFKRFWKENYFIYIVKMCSSYLIEIWKHWTVTLKC